MISSKPTSINLYFTDSLDVIKKLLKAPAQPKARTPRAQNTVPTIRRLVPGLKAETRADGSVVISGPVLTPALTRELYDWLRKRTDDGGA